MRGERPVRVIVPEPDAGTPAGKRRKAERGAARDGGVTAPPPGFDAEVFERLRQRRAALAREHRVPPYVIAHDRTLAELAARRPASRAALHGVFGMGPARIETWGDALLEAIAPPS
jgi:ATP-dependent DNA helicase RecQ